MEQDWKTVVWTKKPVYTKVERTQSQNPAGTKQFRELDGDAPPAPPKVSHSTRQAIQQARQAKKMTQKQLATRLSLQASVIGDYESGKAIPSKALLSRMGQVLGTKLT